MVIFWVPILKRKGFEIFPHPFLIHIAIPFQQTAKLTLRIAFIPYRKKKLASGWVHSQNQLLLISQYAGTVWQRTIQFASQPVKHQHNDDNEWN